MIGRRLRIDHLAQHRLFEACSRHELELIARSCTPITRQAGTVFVREGQMSREFVLVASGSVALSRQGLPEVVIGAERWFGDVELLSDRTSSATVIALTDVDCIVMSRPEFVGVFDTVPSFRKRVVKSVASVARDSLARAGHRRAGLTERWSSDPERWRAPIRHSLGHLIRDVPCLTRCCRG